MPLTYAYNWKIYLLPFRRHGSVKSAEEEEDRAGKINIQYQLWYLHRKSWTRSDKVGQMEYMGS